MRSWAKFIMLFPLLAAALCGGQTADDALVQTVFDRLLATPTATRPNGKYASWPPQVAIITVQRDGQRVAEQNRMNAFAAAPDCRPIVRISEDLFANVVQGDPDRLALILGHELGHVVLGHPVCDSGKDTTSVLEVAITRDQEFAADAKGYEFALAAGFSVRNGLKALQRLDEVSHYSSFEALSVDHPSWADRLARLDKEQAPLWRSMSAFDDGVSFLSTENYQLAATCFRSVVREFPQAADVLSNLGYTLLMQYIDQLSDDDLRSLGIGQPATGSFYGESLHLKSKVRGVDTGLWSEAVQTLQSAEKIDFTLALVKANLGLAYLVSPSGSKPKEALSYLQAATDLLHKDRALQNAYGDTAARAVINNLAVAYLAAGDTADANNLLEFLWKHPKDPVDEQLFLQTASLFYNSGMLLVSSDDPQLRERGGEFLERYLKQAPVKSVWWQLALEKYNAVCKGMSAGCSPESQLTTAHRTPLRTVVAVDLGQGKSLRLGESFKGSANRIGPGQLVGTVPGTNMQRVRYPTYSMDLIASDVIVAIILNGKQSPELQIREVGPASPGRSVHFGMTSDELEAALTGQPYRYEGLLDTWVPYRFYPGVGVAARVGTQKTVEELVIVRSVMQEN